LAFKKIANFCRRLVKIAKNRDHNIDPWIRLQNASGSNLRTKLLTGLNVKGYLVFLVVHLPAVLLDVRHVSPDVVTVPALLVLLHVHLQRHHSGCHVVAQLAAAALHHFLKINGSFRNTQITPSLSVRTYNSIIFLPYTTSIRICLFGF
jgi:hypothetical protein